MMSKLILFNFNNLNNKKMNRTRCFRKRTCMRMLENTLSQMGLIPFEIINSDTVTVTSSEALMDDSLIYMPEITADKELDQSNHESMMVIYDTNPFMDLFHLPESRALMTVKYGSEYATFKVPVFHSFILYAPTNQEKYNLFQTLFSRGINKGFSNLLYSLISQNELDAFVAAPETRMILLPQRRDSSLMEYIEQFSDLKNMFEIMRLQTIHSNDIVPIEILDKVLTEVKDSWMLPQEDEVKEYSMDRIPRSNEHCFPANWSGNVLTETTPGNADHFVKFKDVPETFHDQGLLQENFFSVFVVYLSPQDSGDMHLNIVIGKMNFSEIGSKHAHLVVNLLPEKFHYLFSGEMIKEGDEIKYNLNSGMFYHLHKQRGRREFVNNVGDFNFDEEDDVSRYVRSHFYPETLCWETMSNMVLNSIFQRKVRFVGNIRKPRLSITTDEIEEHCKTNINFSFLAYTDKKKCSGDDKKAKNLCV